MIMDITIPDYKKLHASGAAHELIDVREVFEWNEGHIEGAHLIPFSDLEFEIEKQVPDKASTIVLYCRTGGRSSRAMELLKNMGYTDVRNLVGGYSMWSVDPDNS
jgi:rhodanese-related sulfurtransferase